MRHQRIRPAVKVPIRQGYKYSIRLSGIALVPYDKQISYNYRTRLSEFCRVIEIRGVSGRTGRLLTPNLSLLPEDLDEVAAQWLMYRGLIELAPET